MWERTSDIARCSSRARPMPGKRSTPSNPSLSTLRCSNTCYASEGWRAEWSPPGPPWELENGTLRLWLNPRHHGDHRIATDALVGDTVEVPVVAIDSFVERENIHPVRFIKIDVQGYEPAVCEGMGRVLAANPECVRFARIHALWRCASRVTIPRNWLRV